jgi:hypothetical protein
MSMGDVARPAIVLRCVSIVNSGYGVCREKLGGEGKKAITSGEGLTKIKCGANKSQQGAMGLEQHKNQHVAQKSIDTYACG